MKQADRFFCFCRLCILTTLVLILSLGKAPVTAFAAPGNALYTNTGTGYVICIDDSEDLLTDGEERLLLQKMTGITEYGNAAFVSGSNVGKESLYREYFGQDSGALFIIDMGIREITLWTNGAIYRRISRSYAASIVDNVYRYASRGDYYTCADTAFEQVRTILEGGRIAQPMRHLSNVFAALVLALTGNFIFVWFKKRRAESARNKDITLISGSLKKEVSAADAAQGLAGGAIAAAVLPRVAIGAKQLLKSRKTRRSSGGSSGGGGGGGFSGGGGGGGGGASHRF